MAEESKSSIVQQLIESIGKDGVELLAKYLEQKDKVASGELINSLSYKTQQLLSKFTIDFEYAEHGDYVQLGRLPGSYPPVAAIRKWIQQKGLDLNEYAVAQNIFKFGIKPTPLIDELIESNITENAVKQIEEIYSIEIESKFIDLLEEIKNKR